jgi:hypothetical protein
MMDSCPVEIDGMHADKEEMTAAMAAAMAAASCLLLALWISRLHIYGTSHWRKKQQRIRNIRFRKFEVKRNC